MMLIYARMTTEDPGIRIHVDVTKIKKRVYS